MAATLNVYVKDRVTGIGIGNARVQGLTRNQIIDPPVRQTSGDGGANLYYHGPGFVPPVDVTLIVDAVGYAPWSTNDQPIHFGTHDVDYIVELEPSSFKKPLAELAKLRGAMWTARLNLPWGPRPGQDDNCICIDYFECFSVADQDRILAAYGPSSERHYSTAPLGPIVDAGYHGQLPATDWRGDFSVYLDAAAKLEAAGIGVVHFLRPDRGVAGLEWTVADLDRELTPLFSSPRAQALMSRVVLGWEPGPRYFYNNDWWVAMCQWQARVFPRALRGIHMVSDCDAPVGGDDDVRGISNGQGWANVAPYIHFWIVQNAGYTDSNNEVPTPEFYQNFTDQFNPAVRGSFYDRFKTGGPTGDWPTTSAWSAEKVKPILNGEAYEGIVAMPGEYAAFADYWKNFHERYSQDLGEAAMRAGAYGFLDGGRS
jgi:hypothetical protein